MIKEKEFVPLIEDILFKEAFSHPDNREFLEYFLEVFLELEKGYLHGKLEVAYENTLANKKYGEKQMRGDIIVKYEDTIVNLEAYRYLDEESSDKSMHYIMKIYSSIGVGRKYKERGKVIQINIVDGNKKGILPEKVCSKFVIYDSQAKFSLFQDRFVIYYYQIDKAREIKYNESDEVVKLLKFIGARSKDERDKAVEGNKIMSEFNEWVEEYMHEDGYMKKLDEWAVKIDQEKIRKFAKEEGITQGSLEEQLNIAKKMLEKDLPTEIISSCTGLSLEEIFKLKDKD